jgi:hypothetical protein
MVNTIKTLFISLLLLVSELSVAGGPLVLEGPNGNTPVTYQDPNITVHAETGTLGTLTTNAEANAMVEQAFALWNNVNTSTVNLIVNTTQINTDIDHENFDTYIPSVDGTVFNANDNLNPVVYDSDGKIIDAFFGPGQSNVIAGFAASIFTSGSSHFNEGYIVLNGKDLGQSNTKFKLLIAHEIGHFFGIDHSQVNINNQETDFGLPEVCTTETNKQNYPVMYPFICRDEESLHSDDISAVSALYPATNINANFGILEGRFVNDAGRAILGANIWAENIKSGETYSIVSDYLKQGSGYYKLYLPAGTYTLHANSINTLFYGGSGIGPYSEYTTSVSFQDPHPIAQVNYLGDTDSNIEIITILDNQSIEINFSSSGKFIIIPENTDDDDFFDKLFGATSFETVLLILFLVITGRRISCRKRT